MNTHILLEKLAIEFSDILGTLSPIDDASFFHKEQNEKWSGAEHLHHLTLSFIPVNNRLRSPQSMLETWGSSNRASRTYEDFSNDYIKAVDGEKWKAFPPFVPVSEKQSTDYFQVHSPSNKKAVDDFYQLTGNQIQALPQKVVLNIGEGKQKVTDNFSFQLSAMLKLSSGFSDAELDNYQLPLPYIGLITVKEILYFNHMHIRHHHESIRQLFRV